MPGRSISTLTRARFTLVAFLCLSALLVPLILAACDSGATANPGTPVPRSADVVFQRYCNVCHPGGGFGAGPSLILALPDLSDSQVRDIVRHGKKRMPGFSTTEFSDAELDELIVYIRTMK
jgi:mono/diheme cytochrome c family protein